MAKQHHAAGLAHSTARPSSSKSASMSANIVGVHYRVGKKVGEGSFGVLYEVLL
ncbi:Putative Casein kinase I [Lichtheimia ramosa]|uniref:Putative Casein kinase I n=1 Tax=Lichtheimia ramosa TaxID=688394 RepID=A0A077WGV7_9FUNG|nr:Putative Casein kinase I [Lichtheimia ramosa]